MLDGTDMLEGADVRGVGEQVQAIRAGFNVAEWLAEIVDEVRENGFRRRRLR